MSNKHRGSFKKDIKYDLHRNLRAYNRHAIREILKGKDPDGMAMEESKNRFSDIWDYD